jgi:hypothetical protein
MSFESILKYQKLGIPFYFDGNEWIEFKCDINIGHAYYIRIGIISFRPKNIVSISHGNIRYYLWHFQPLYWNGILLVTLERKNVWCIYKIKYLLLKIKEEDLMLDFTLNKTYFLIG